MDTPQQYPTMWTTGYIGSLKVSFTFPIRNELEAYTQAKAITDKLIADGFTTNEPGLEEGEIKEKVGSIVRRKKKNSDNTITPIVDLYPTSDKAVYKFLSVYLNTPEEVKAFEDASGVMVGAGKNWPGDAAPSKENEDAKEYFVKPRVDFMVVHKANPLYEEGNMKPKRLFVRWEVANAQPPPTPQPQPQLQPSQTATPPAGKPEADEARNAELRNEELVITRIEPRSDSTGWYGYGLFNDGISNQEVRVNLFAPEDPQKITEGGYQWVTSGKVQWPVILRIDRNMTRIDTVTAKQTSETLGTPSSAKNGQPAIEPAWYATQAKDCWGVIKGWLLKNMYAKNAFHMNGSFHKHGITVDSKGQQLTPEWADSCAGDLIKYLEQNRELATAS